MSTPQIYATAAELDSEVARQVNSATTGGGYPSARSISAAFEHAVAVNPGRVALVCGDVRLDYRQLQTRALEVSDQLAASGIGPGDLVGLRFGKGIDYVSAVLGVLRAGAIFMPLPAEWPAQRVETVVDEARPAAVLSPAGIDVLGTNDSDDGPDRAVEAAYVLFTSGSTGTPKGVTIGNNGAMLTTDVSVRDYGIGPNDRILGLSSIAFDLSVWDMLAALTSGAALILPTEHQDRNPDGWLALMSDEQVSVVMGAPALLDMLVTAAAASSAVLDRWRLTFAGGDWIPLTLPARARDVGCSDMRFVSIGGATECSLFTMVFEVDDVDPRWTSIPYGRPIAGHTAYVLDSEHRLCPVGVKGEIWYGGGGVGLGYWRDIVRSAESFVDHPISGERLYRSGDLGLYRHDGHIELVGRTDNQVQLRGHRIELGEIETQLGALDDVSAAVVTVRWSGGTPRAAAGLVAHVVSPVAGAQLRSDLGATVPDYAVPGEFIFHDTLPLTGNGKWDRAALARIARPAAAGSPDGDRVELDAHAAVIAAVWAAELNLDELQTTALGPDANFFELGGDSLSAVRVAYALRQRHGLDVRIDLLSRTPILCEFAEQLGDFDLTADEVPAERPAHDAANRYEPFPLTDQQQAYVLGRGDDYVSGNVACHVYVEYSGIEGPDERLHVDVARLERAWQRVIAKHDALRIVIDPAAMTQRVLPQVPDYRIEIIEGADELAVARERMSHEVRPVDQWPLFSVAAVRQPHDRFRLLLSIDALITDFRGLRVILDDLALEYERDRPVVTDTTAFTYRDYVLAAGDLERGAESIEAERYWRDRLDSLPGAPKLPMVAVPGAASSTFVPRSTVIAARDWSQVTRQASARGLSSTAVLIATFAATVARWADSGHFVLNIPNFNRLPLHPAVGDLVGEFATFTLLEVNVDEYTSFPDFCHAVQGQLWADVDRGRLSGVRVLRELAARRGGLDGPFAPIVLTSEVAIDGGDNERALGGRLTEDFALTQTPQVWMDMRIEERAGSLRINWDVIDDLFAAGMPQEMFDHFTGSLTELARQDDWDRWRSREPQIEGGRGVGRGYGDQRDHRGGAHEAFFAHAAEDGSRAAFHEAGRVISRAEVAEAARSVAAELIGRGVGAGDIVAIGMRRSWHQYATIYGILASGAAYLPLDVDQPASRIDAVLTVARPVAVVTDSSGFEAAGSAEIQVITYADIEIRAHDRTSLRQTNGDDLAYVLFTSGSTGTPKGVMITHSGVVNCVEATIEEFGLGRRTCSLAVAAVHHDMSVFDVFVAPAAGGSVCVLDHARQRDPEHWVRRGRSAGVNAVCAVPAVIGMLCDGIDHVGAGPDLDVVLTGGDWVPPQLVERVRGHDPRARVVSIGGPTETTAWNIWYPMDPDAAVQETIPYGHPIAGTRYRIVDAHGEDRPRWAVGEMVVSGVGVAAGYLNLPDLTAERFGEDAGVRTFRTGDRGYFDADGEIRFVGRQDHQIKIRGHRIELGEIESALRAVTGASHAVAMAVTETDDTPGGRIRGVVGFVGRSDATPPDGGEIVELLRERLPDAFVPLKVVVLDALPLTSNGKVDRARLPDVGLDPVAGNDVGPRSPLEDVLVSVWEDVLEVSGVGTTDNFFSLGGNSLLASRIILRLRSVFEGTGIGVQVVVNTKDIAAMARALRAVEPEPGFLDEVAGLYQEIEAMSEDGVDTALH